MLVFFFRPFRIRQHWSITKSIFTVSQVPIITMISLQLFLSLLFLTSPLHEVSAVSTSAVDHHEAAHHVPRAVEHNLENSAVVNDELALGIEEKEWTNARRHKRALRSQIVSFGSSAAAAVASSINSRISLNQSPLRVSNKKRCHGEFLFELEKHSFFILSFLITHYD